VTCGTSNESKRSLRHGKARAQSESRCSSGPPAAHGPLAGPAAGGAKVGMRRRVGPLRVAQLLRPARSPRSQEWSRGRRCRGVMRRRVVSRSGSSSSSSPRAASDPKSGLAAGGAEMRMRRRVVSRSGSSSSSSPRAASDPKSGLAAGGAEMRMRRREASAARPRTVVPVGPTADGAASYSAVQLQRSPRTAHGPSWARGRRCPAEHEARCRSCGVLQKRDFISVS
jgi:hypothetical protein